MYQILLHYESSNGCIHTSRLESDYLDNYSLVMWNSFLIGLHMDLAGRKGGFFLELNRFLSISSTAGHENPVVYVASDVPKRISLTSAACSTSPVQAPYVGITGRGYRRNSAWVTIPP